MTQMAQTPMENSESNHARLTRLRMENEIVRRRYMEEVQELMRRLSKISDEDVKELGFLFPQLERVRSLTVEEILENKHGEYALLSKLYEDATNHLKRTFELFENNLC